MAANETTNTLLTWTIRPAATRPGKAAWTCFYLAVVVGLVWVIFLSVWFTLAAAIALVGATAEFLWPVTFTLTSEGAERRSVLGRRKLAWPRVKAAAKGPEGVMLSPVHSRGLARAYQGLFLAPGDRGGTPTVDEIAAVVAKMATERDVPTAETDEKHGSNEKRDG